MLYRFIEKKAEYVNINQSRNIRQNSEENFLLKKNATLAPHRIFKK